MDIEAWVKLGLIEKRLGRYTDAENCCRRAIAIAPRTGLAHYALGTVLQSQGRVQEAIHAYRQARQYQPDYADTHYWLGNALHQSGAMRDAIASYRQAIKLKPNFPEALGDLGAALLDLGEIEQAADLLQRALAMQPANPVINSNMSHALRLQGKVDQALDNFRRALRLTPNAIEVIAGLAGLLEKTGQLTEAEELTRHGLQLAPESAAINLVAAQLDRRNKRLQQAADRLETLRNQPLSMDIAGEVELTLGQLYDHMEDSQRSLPLIISGNDKKARASLQSESQRSQYLQRVQAMAALATPQLAERMQQAVATNSCPADPIFLIGFPRSGTTLMEQILDSHPRLQAMEEKGAVGAMVNAFLATSQDRPEALAELNESDIARLRQVYFDEAGKHIDLRPDSILVDKMPLNTVEVPVIRRVFPRAKFILAVRHPCDVSLSCLMQNFAVNAAMANFFSLEDTVQAYVAVMKAWQKYAELLPLDYHRIRYEDLIEDVPGETRRLLDFLGIDWNDAVLDHTGHARQRATINTPSYHQVVQPVYQNAKYRWKRYEQAFSAVLPALQPFIEYFGY